MQCADFCCGTRDRHLFFVAFSLWFFRVVCSFPFSFCPNRNYNLPVPRCSGSVFMVGCVSLVQTNERRLCCRRTQMTSLPVPPRSALSHIYSRYSSLLIKREFSLLFFFDTLHLLLSSFVHQLACLEAYTRSSAAPTTLCRTTFRCFTDAD